MRFLRQKQAKANIWLRSQMTQFLRNRSLGGTCEQKCLVSHLQVTDGGRSGQVRSGSDKTWNLDRETVSTHGISLSEFVSMTGTVRWSHWCLFGRKRAAPEVTEGPQMSRWRFAMESQPVSLTVMVGPTQNPSNHQARQWQDLSRVESILGPTLIESRVHTLSSISLSILTPERQSDRWESLELDKPSVSEKWRRKVGFGLLGLVSS